MIKTYPYPEGLEFNKEYKVILKDTVTGKDIHVFRASLQLKNLVKLLLTKR